MDILASMKCISVSRLLGFTLISLPRKFIICLSVPDSSMVAFKGINYDFQVLSSVSQRSNFCYFGHALLVDQQGPCTSQTTACNSDHSFKASTYIQKADTQPYSCCFQCEISCKSLHKKLENHVGTIKKQFFSPPRYSKYFFCF